MLLRFKSTRIDIVIDQSFTSSTKDFEHSSLNESISQVKIAPNQISPHNFVAELKNIQFKEAPVNFFIGHWIGDIMAPFIGNKIIYVNFNKCYSYRVENDKVTRTVDDSLSCEEHEEADPRICLFIFHLHSQGAINPLFF